MSIANIFEKYIILIKQPIRVIQIWLCFFDGIIIDKIIEAYPARIIIILEKKKL